MNNNTEITNDVSFSIYINIILQKSFYRVIFKILNKLFYRRYSIITTSRL